MMAVCYLLTIYAVIRAERRSRPPRLGGAGGRRLRRRRDDQGIDRHRAGDGAALRRHVRCRLAARGAAAARLALCRPAGQLGRAGGSALGHPSFQQRRLLGRPVVVGLPADAGADDRALPAPGGLAASADCRLRGDRSRRPWRPRGHRWPCWCCWRPGRWPCGDGDRRWPSWRRGSSSPSRRPRAWCRSSPRLVPQRRMYLPLIALVVLGVLGVRAAIGRWVPIATPDRRGGRRQRRGVGGADDGQRGPRPRLSRFAARSGRASSRRGRMAGPSTTSASRWRRAAATTRRWPRTAGPPRRCPRPATASATRWPAGATTRRRSPSCASSSPAGRTTRRRRWPPTCSACCSRGKATSRGAIAAFERTQTMRPAGRRRPPGACRRLHCPGRRAGRGRPARRGHRCLRPRRRSCARGARCAPQLRHRLDGAGPHRPKPSRPSAAAWPWRPITCRCATRWRRRWPRAATMPPPPPSSTASSRSTPPTPTPWPAWRAGAPIAVTGTLTGASPPSVRNELPRRDANRLGARVPGLGCREEQIAPSRGHAARRRATLWSGLEAELKLCPTHNRKDVENHAARTAADGPRTGRG